MKRLFLAAAAAALVAPGASAATGSCLVLTDPAGDVQAHEALPAFPAAREFDAVDVVSVEIEATTGDAITASFTVAGSPEPSTGMRNSYTVRFHDDVYDYHLSANLGNTVVWPLSTPYELAVVHRASGQRSTYSVSGTVGFVPRTVTVSAPQSLVPLLYPLDPGRELTVDSIDTYAGPVLSYGPLDSVAAPHTLVVGEGCS